MGSSRHFSSKAHVAGRELRTEARVIDCHHRLVVTAVAVIGAEVGAEFEPLVAEVRRSGGRSVGRTEELEYLGRSHTHRLGQSRPHRRDEQSRIQRLVPMIGNERAKKIAVSPNVRRQPPERPGPYQQRRSHRAVNRDLLSEVAIKQEARVVRGQVAVGVVAGADRFP